MNPSTLPARHMTNVHLLRTELGLTQKELARHANVSPQLLLRAEQGLHPHLSTSIAQALSELYNKRFGSSSVISPNEIKRAYKETRQKNIRLFSDDLTTSKDYDSIVRRAITYAINNGGSPFQRFRVYLFEHYGIPSSGIKFCTYTGLHSAVLSSVENGRVTWREAKALHRVLSHVLGLSEEEIYLLGKHHDNFYLRVHND